MGDVSKKDCLELVKVRPGLCYKNGDGVAVDKAEAVRWFRLVANQRYSIAQFNLGLCYKNGDGVALDNAEVVRWFRLAVDQGHCGAQRELELM